MANKLVGQIDVDIKLLYYLHLPRRGDRPLQNDLDSMWRYRTWQKVCECQSILPTPRNIRTLILEYILDGRDR